FKFVSGGEPAASSFFGKLGFVVLVASLLPFFLGPHREGLIDLGGAAAADFLFEFLDASLGRFELPLEGHDDVDQAIDADASRDDILLKLLVGVHAKNLSNRQPRSCPSFENSVNGPIFCRGPCVRDLTATPDATLDPFAHSLRIRLGTLAHERMGEQDQQSLSRPRPPSPPAPRRPGSP